MMVSSISSILERALSISLNNTTETAQEGVHEDEDMENSTQDYLFSSTSIFQIEDSTDATQIIKNMTDPTTTMPSSLLTTTYSTTINTILNTTTVFSELNSTMYSPDTNASILVENSLLNKIPDTTELIEAIFNTEEAFQNESLNSTIVQEEALLDISGLDPTLRILILTPLVLLTIFIILGNLLVIIAVFTRKSLRSPQNIYIVSLAGTDMSVAIFVLPFNLITLSLQKWTFGDLICKIYLTLDVCLCTVSIFHLCAIGIDRYRAISEGIHYVQKRNLRSVLYTIGIIWLIVLWIGSPPLLAQGEWSIISHGYECSMPTSAGFHIHLVIGALFFPLFIMSVIYWKIYCAIRMKLRERSKFTCLELTSDLDSTTTKFDKSEDEIDAEEIPKNTLNRKLGKRKASEQINTFIVNKQRFSLSRERKAAKTLGIIMAAFILCWIPLGFLNIIVSLVLDDSQSDGIIVNVLFQLFTWLGYLNSALNPIIYAISNQDFKKAFRKILKIDQCIQFLRKQSNSNIIEKSTR